MNTPDTKLLVVRQDSIRNSSRIWISPAVKSSALVVRLALLALVVCTTLLGFLSVGLVRPLFVAGCFGVAVLAIRGGPPLSVEILIIMFSIAPLLRRVADFELGYDASGYMLLGPLAAMLVPTFDLLRGSRISSQRNGSLLPILTFGCCIVYGIVLSAIRGDFMAAGTAGVKTVVPLIYGIWITRNASQSVSMIDAASRTLLFMMPLLGLYGLWQYVDPLSWDRYWMFQSQMNSIGSPEPYSVRVFSTFNSPASFAFYCAFALLLIGYCRSGWLATISALPIGLGMLLSSSRTHWIAVIIGVAYCCAFSKTRFRSMLLAALLGLSIVVAGFAGPEIADSIAQRIETLTGSVSEDGSGAARLDQFSAIYSELDELLVGAGFGANGLSAHPGMVLDGEIAGAIFRLGYVVGTISIACLIWTIVLGIRHVDRRSTPQVIVIGAVLVGSLFQLLLASVTTGEIGFLFWLSIGLTSSKRPASNVDA